MPPVSRAYLAKSNGHRRVDGSSASPKWTARNGLRSTTRGTRSSRDKTSFSIAWNKSCGRCHRSEEAALPVELRIVTEYPLLIECDAAIAVEIGANARTLRDRLMHACRGPLAAALPHLRP